MMPLSENTFGIRYNCTITAAGCNTSLSFMGLCPTRK
jgi:hypothetical protein